MIVLSKPRQLQLQICTFLVLGLFITIATLIPGDYVPDIPSNDKTNHLLSFFIWAAAVTSVRTRLSLVLWLTIALWGGAIELIQPYFGRWAELLDFVADITGAVAGGIVGTFILSRLVKQPRPAHSETP